MAGVSTGGGLGRLGALFACGSLGGKTDAELLEHFARGEAAEAAFEALVVRTARSAEGLPSRAAGPE